MPKAQTHWIHDLAAATAVLAAVGLVFWLLPLPVEAHPLAAEHARVSAASLGCRGC